MKKSRKFLGMLLSVVLCIGLLPLGVAAEEITEPVSTEEVSESVDEEESIVSEEENADITAEEDVADDVSDGEDSVIEPEEDITTPAPEEETTAPTPEDETDETAGADVTPTPEPASDKRPSDLSVGGVWVTDENAADILGDGTASYDPDTATLTLKGAVIKAGTNDEEPAAIKSGSAINIVLEGENKIDVLGQYIEGIHSNAGLNITGSGSLDIHTSSFASIHSAGDLLIDGSDIYVNNADGTGIFSETNVTFNNAYVRVLAAKGAVYASAEGASNCVLRIYGSYVDASNMNEEVLYNALAAGEIIIDGYSDVYAYSAGLSAIAATDAVSIKGSSIVSGYSENDSAIYAKNKISINDSFADAFSTIENYAFDTSVLTASDAFIVMNGVFGEGINESVTDSIMFNDDEGTVIGNYTILDDMIVNVPEGYSLTIPEGASVTVPAGTDFVNFGKVTVEGEFINNGGTVENKGEFINNGGTVDCGSTHINLVKVEAKEPTATETGNIEYWYCDACGKHYEDAEASQEIDHYDTIVPFTSRLCVGGVWVTDENAADIFGDGTVSYDAASKTLTLNNATITAVPSSEFVPAAIETWGDINIVLNGRNTIETSEIEDSYGILTDGSITLTGEGNLIIKSDSIGICSFGDDIVLNGANIAVYSSDSVIAYGEGMLDINGGTLLASSLIYGDSIEISDDAFVISVSSDPDIPAIGSYGSVSISSSTVYAFSESAAAIDAETDIVIRDSYVLADTPVANGAFKAQSLEASGTWIEMRDEMSADIAASITGSVVFVGNSGEVFGSYTVPEGTIVGVGEDDSLLIPEGASVTVPAGAEFYNSGEVLMNGEFIVEEGGTVYCDPGHHINLVKVEEKKATDTEEGNIEYWHCTACGKYYSDAEGSNEISYEDTIIPVLTEEEEKPEDTTDMDDKQPSGGNTDKDSSKPSGGKNNTSPETGDRNDTEVWISLIAVAAAALAGGVIYNKKKR